MDYNEKLKSKLEKLAQFGIHVSEDPVADGLYLFHKKISELNRKMNELLVIRNVARMNKSINEEKVEDLKSSIKVNMNQLFTDDEDVRKGKSAGDRVATAELKLTKKFQELRSVEKQSNLARAYMDCVENTHYHLKAAKDLLELQVDVIKQEGYLTSGLSIKGSASDKDLKSGSINL